MKRRPRRRPWLFVGVLGSLLGPDGGATEAPVAPEQRASLARGRSAEAGHAVAGRRFFVWEEDRRSSETWASELRKLDPRPPRLRDSRDPG